VRFDFPTILKIGNKVPDPTRKGPTFYSERSLVQIRNASNSRPYVHLAEYDFDSQSKFTQWQPDPPLRLSLSIKLLNPSNFTQGSRLLQI